MIMMVIDIRGWMGSKVSDICFAVKVEPGKKPEPGKLFDRGSNLGPLDERQRCYPTATAVVTIL